MSNSKIFKTAFAAVAASALLLTGCSGAKSQKAESWTYPKDDPKATIRVLSILSLDAEGMQNVIDKFHEVHPTINVEWETVPFSDLNSVVESRVSQKNGSIDVYWVDQPRVASLASRGYLEDLTDQFKDRNEKWDDASKEASSYGGRLWSTPISTSTQILYYNKTLLDKAGIQPPSAKPENRITWEKLTQDAKEVQKKAGVQWGLALGQFDRYYQMQPILMGAGGGTGVTGKDNLTPAVVDKGWEKALTWYRSIFEDKIAPRGEEEVQDDFLAGNIAYLEQGTWLIDGLADVKFEWGAALSPTFEGKDPVTPTGSWSLGMNPYSKEKAASAIFMDWMSSEDGYTKNRPLPDLAATESGREAYYSKEIFNTPAGKDAKDIIAYELANTSVTRPNTIGYVEFEEILNRAFADIRNGAEPHSTLETAQKQLENAWKVYE